MNTIKNIAKAAGVNEYANEHGYDLILFQSRPTGDRTYYQMCRERQLEGVITQNLPHDHTTTEELAATGLPSLALTISCSRSIFHRRLPPSIRTGIRWGAQPANYLSRRLKAEKHPPVW